MTNNITTIFHVQNCTFAIIVPTTYRNVSDPKFCFMDKMSSQTIEESEASCNSFCSNPYGVKSVEYRELLFISLGSPLVALERDIFKLTKGCLMSEKIEPK